MKEREKEKVQASLDFGKRIIKENQEIERKKAEKIKEMKLEDKKWVDSLLEKENEEKLKEELAKVLRFLLGT